MSWFSIRTALEATTHTLFQEPGTYTPPGGGAGVAVVGVLSQAVAVEEDTSGRTGYETEQDVYEVRKATGVTASDFAVRGTLTLDSGAVFRVQWITQTDTLITLGLSPG